MRFDFEGARKAGLSDSEIVQYISTLPNNGNLDTLREMGASDSHIVDLLSGSKNFSITNPQEYLSTQ